MAPRETYEEEEEMMYDFRDLDLCARADYEYRTNPFAKDGILFKCFNKEDVDKLKRIMTNLYPHVPVYFKWLIFEG